MATSRLLPVARTLVLAVGCLVGVTAEAGWLIVTTDGRREKRAVSDKAEYQALLKEHFGVEL